MHSFLPKLIDPFVTYDKSQLLLSHAQVQHNSLHQVVTHPLLGEVGVVGPAVRYSASTNQVRGPPPSLGQHTDAVIKTLGYSEEEIKHLRLNNVIA